MEEEIGQPIEIQSISFMVEEYFSSWKDSVSIYLALTDLDELSEYYADNYDPQTRQLVLEVDTLYYGETPGEWFAVDLQQPFWYPGSGNLVIELVSPGADGGYTDIYNWDTSRFRALVGYDCASPVGTLDYWVPYLLLSGPLGLDQRTFGSIKAGLGGH